MIFPTCPKKSGQKFEYFKNKKSMKKNFIIFKGFSLKQIKPTFLEGENPTLKNNATNINLLCFTTENIQFCWPEGRVLF